MLSLLLQRLLAWLCLAAAALTGSIPAQGFVLCIRPDGRVSVDLSAPAAHCVCCDDEAPGAPGGAELARAPQDDCCPCADLPVPSALQERSNPSRTIELQLAPSTAPPPAVLPAPAPAAQASHARRAEVPRAPDSLALIRSVVLLL